MIMSIFRNLLVKGIFFDNFDTPPPPLFSIPQKLLIVHYVGFMVLTILRQFKQLRVFLIFQLNDKS